MKKWNTFLPAFCIVVASALNCAAQTELPPPPAGTPPFEEPPTLTASEILLPDFLSGPNFKTREPVPTYAGANRYTLDTDFGVFDANGSVLLVQRVREINAIAAMREISKSDEFRSALKTAAKSPLMIGKQLISNPVDTLSGVPKGIWKFMNRAGQGIKEASEGRQKSEYEDSTAQSMIGFSKVKRKIAMEFGVDPYSTNSVFQEELNSIAWASYAGQMTIKGAMAVFTGGASTAISAVSMTGALNDALREKSPGDLRLMNLGKLEKMGISRGEANAFLNNPALSPTHQTGIVFVLEELNGVSGRSRFIQLATQAEDETDGLFFMGTAALIARVQKDGANLTRISSSGGLPVCLAKDGTVIVALQWDYAAWTPLVGRFAESLHTAKYGAFKPTGYRVVITGDASPSIQQAMKTLGVRFDIRQVPGPLK
jgi:hypothetical protein